MIYLFIGPIGSGKTYGGLKYAFQKAQKNKTFVITNQPVNRVALDKWAQKTKNWYIQYLLDRDGIKVIDNSEVSVYNILEYGNSTVFLDECAIFFPSRVDYKNPVPKEFWADLLLSRKGKIDLIGVTQHSDLVDKNFSRNCEWVFQCESSPLLGGRELFTRYILDGFRYDEWRMKSRGYWETLLTFKGSREQEISSPLFWSTYDSFSTLGAKEGFKTLPGFSAGSRYDSSGYLPARGYGGVMRPPSPSRPSSFPLLPVPQKKPPGL